MESKVIKVFYGEDLLPYKDSAREVHYPITGSTFACSNKTNTIRFYVDQIGGTVGVSWVVVSKLPNGTLGYEPVSNVGTDSEIGENYIEFELSSYYTQYKGVVKLALRGYNGNIAFDEASGGVYTISGTPLIEVSGTIDVAINYSPFVNTGTEILPTDVDRILAALSGYTPIGNSIVVVQTKPNASSLTNFDNGQLFYVKNEKSFYLLNNSQLYPYLIGDLSGNDLSNYGLLTISYLNAYVTYGAWFSGYNSPYGGSTPLYPNALYFIRIKQTGSVYKTEYFAFTEQQSVVYGYVEDDGSSTLYNVINNSSSVKGVLASEGWTEDKIAEELLNYYTKEELDSLIIDIGNNNSGTFSDEEIEIIKNHNNVILIHNGISYYQSESHTAAAKLYIRNALVEANTVYYKPIVSSSINVSINIKRWTYTNRSIDVYSKQNVDDLLAGLKQNEFQDVDTTTYPTLEDFLDSEGEEGYIYLYPIDVNDLTQGYYQYIWENNEWRSIGTTQINLDNYVTLSGSPQTITTQKTFSGKAIFNDANLYNGYLTTNSKNYFTRVGVTTGQYVTYKLPYNYSDVGAQTYTLETQEHVASNYVPTSRTIAGIDLQDNVSSQELTDALVFATDSDIDNLFV